MVLEFGTRRIVPPSVLPFAKCLDSRGGASRSVPSLEKATRLSRSFRLRSEISPARSSIIAMRHRKGNRSHFRVASRITRSIYLTLPPPPLPSRVYLQRRRKRNRRVVSWPLHRHSAIKLTSLLLLCFIYICISKPFRVEILIPLDVPRGG